MPHVDGPAARFGSSFLTGHSMAISEESASLQGRPSASTMSRGC
jgi:hypothetical protein